MYDTAAQRRSIQDIGGRKCEGQTLQSIRDRTFGGKDYDIQHCVWIRITEIFVISLECTFMLKQDHYCWKNIPPHCSDTDKPKRTSSTLSPAVLFFFSAPDIWWAD